MILIFSTSTSPTFNLAAEEYLFSTRKDDVLFLYVNEPSVILGSNQAIQNEVNIDFCQKNNIQIVRRLSGGGAVFHDLGNFNFSFITNKKNQNSSFNGEFLKPIIDVLKSLDIEVKKGIRNDLWLNDEFKISGTASHIKKTRELHHGTLLYDSNLELLEESLTSLNRNMQLKAIPSVPSKVLNIKEYLLLQKKEVYQKDNFFVILMSRLREYFGLTTMSVLSASDNDLIEQLEESKYKNTDWTFKK